MHGTEDASAWVRRWSHLVPAGQPVLDVACGAGRHMRWFAARGHAVTGVDRDAQALALAAASGQTVQADIENGPWPLTGHQFGGVVVTNYLWRDLMPAIVACVAPGGVLIYETFAEGNETVGRPARPEFLLRHGELLELAGARAGLRVVAYEDGFIDAPPRFVQRIAALCPVPGDLPGRHDLGKS